MNKLVGGVVMMILSEGDINECIPIAFIYFRPLWFLVFKANLICHGL